jgi:aerobic-type carbon monoxide dehydrogenase small subunit (CoxS/CutS family)
MAQVTKLNVNGSARTIDADADLSLLSVLRDQLDLTVLIDGSPRRSCITPVGAVGQKQITTIEGLAQGDRLHPLQEAFLEEAAMQCAYCTSGMIMTAVSLLHANPNPSAADISHSMEGNICRCGTHPRIVAAIQKAAKALNQSMKESTQ